MTSLTSSPGLAKTPQSELWNQAEESVLRDLIYALFYENLFDIRKRASITKEDSHTARIPDFSLTINEQYLYIEIEPGATHIILRIPFLTTLERVSISRAPAVILRIKQGRFQWKLTDSTEMLRLFTLAGNPDDALQLWPNLQGVLHDLKTAITHTTLALEATSVCPGSLRSPLEDQLMRGEQIAALRDRPFHPTARSKSGWNIHDYRKFSAAFGYEFSLEWVAIKRDRITCSESARDSHPASFILNDVDSRLLNFRLKQCCPDPNEYLILPVHPWQMTHVITQVFANEIADKVVIPLHQPLGLVKATTSGRTLAISHNPWMHLKIPVGIVSLGGTRGLPPHYLQNGEHAQNLLEQAQRMSPQLANRLSLCHEKTWWTFSPPGGNLFEKQSEHVGCLLRRYPEPGPSHSLMIPMSALAVVTPDRALPSWDELLERQSGAPPLHNRVLSIFQTLCNCLTEVALTCFSFGLMPELHGQNIIAVFSQTELSHLLLRDHDTLRVHLPWVQASSLPHPDYQLRPQSPNTLILDHPEQLLEYFQTLGIQVNLWSIGDALSRGLGISEHKIWACIHLSIFRCLEHLELPEPVRHLVRTKLLEHPIWPAKLVLTPLLQQSTPPDSSMPNQRGECTNPFHSQSPDGVCL